MARICKHCGNEYTTWFCPCRRKRLAAARRRAASRRRWNVSSARARILGGFAGMDDVGAILGPYSQTVEREPENGNDTLQ